MCLLSRSGFCDMREKHSQLGSAKKLFAELYCDGKNNCNRSLEYGLHFLVRASLELCISQEDLKGLPPICKCHPSQKDRQYRR